MSCLCCVSTDSAVGPIYDPTKEHREKEEKDE